MLWAHPVPPSRLTPPLLLTARASIRPAATWRACTISTCSPSPPRGRYGLHDLLREHARALAAAGDPADGDAAAGRLLDYYLHTAAAAGQHIASQAITPARPPPGDPPALAPQLSTHGQASAWLDAERPNLHAAAVYAAATGRPAHATAIAGAISGFLFSRGHLDQAATMHQAALTTARQAGDRPGRPMPSTSWACCSG